jgi:predicted PurR-regulated permease PerM
MARAPADLHGSRCAPPVAAGPRAFYLLSSSALLVAALYWAQKVLILLALAILLGCLLAPPVARLERRGLRRFTSVVLVVGLAFLLIGLAGWSIASQVSGLLGDLPRYKKDVHDKIVQLQGTAGGGPGLLATVQDFLDEVERHDREGARSAPSAPVVRVRPERPSLFAQLQAVLGQFLGVW